MSSTRLGHLLFACGLLLCSVTALHNLGVISMDDYDNAVALMIPAQRQAPILDALHKSVHPPVPKYIVHLLAQASLALGITDPHWQLRFCQLLLGLWCFSLVAWSTAGLFDDQRKRNLTLAFLAFFFFSPLFMTRPMIESLSMPFLAVSLFFATRYHKHGSQGALAGSVFALVIASILRYQLGVCCLAIAILVAMRRRASDWAVMIGTGMVGFLLTGLTDLLMGKTFHASLIAYVTYNMNAGEFHGRTPAYAYPLLWLGLTLPPTFFSRYRGLNWRATYSPLLPALLYFVIFTVAHSVTPHKEDRFMVPAMPMFLALLVPLADFLFRQRSQRWRLIYAVTLNGILLVGISYNIPQRNVIALAQYAGDEMQFSSLVSVGTSVVLYPQAYSAREIPARSVNPEDLSDPSKFACDEILVVRYDFKPAVALLLDAHYNKIAEFAPGLFEQIVVWTNERRNARRGKLEAYLPARCGLVTKNAAPN